MKSRWMRLAGIVLAAAALVAACDFTEKEEEGTYKYFVLVANAAAGKLSVYSMNSSSGALKEVTGSPYTVGAEPQSVAVDPTGQYVYVANYFSDSISAFAIDPATGELATVTGSPFSPLTRPWSRRRTTSR